MVLPVPVPPVTRSASRASTTARTHGTTSRGSDPAATSVVEVEGATPRHAQRQARAGHGDRGEDRVHPGAVGQARVDVGRRVVEAATAGGGEPLGEPAHLVVAPEPDVDRLGATPAVDPHLVGCRHQHVGHQRVAQQPGQRSGAGHLAVQPFGLGEQEVGTEQHAVVAQRPCDVGSGRDLPLGDEAVADPFDHRRRQAHRGTSTSTSSPHVRASRERGASPGGSPRSSADARRVSCPTSAATSRSSQAASSSGSSSPACRRR